MDFEASVCYVSREQFNQLMVNGWFGLAVWVLGGTLK